MEEFMIGFFVAYFVVIFLTMAYSITSYVLNSLGMYTIAKRRGIQKPWLSWVPVASVWTLGCISDQYRYVVKGENKSKRKILLGLSIGQILCVIVFYVLYFVMFFKMMSSAMDGASEEEVLTTVFSTLGSLLLLYIPMIAMSILQMIFTYMAMYDLYTSCSPSNNVLFLLLSIFLGIHPFIIFFIRKKDGGMPPRREPVQAIPPQIGWQPPQQPQYTWQPPQDNASGNNEI